MADVTDLSLKILGKHKFHSFINERNVDKVAFMIYFGIDCKDGEHVEYT